MAEIGTKYLAYYEHYRRKMFYKIAQLVSVTKKKVFNADTWLI
jgi:hypothetical protein